MQQNILRTSDVTKIYFTYIDGKKLSRKETVTVKYMDKNHCYFVGQSIQNFSKPGWRAKAKVIVYTPEGIYHTEAIIRDITYSFQEILYKIDLPKIWNFKQLRSGSRKLVELPVKIKFSDNVEISTVTYDIAIGGISIKTDKNLTTVHKSFPAECSIEFPTEGYINFPEGKLTTPVKYVRTKKMEEDFYDNTEIHQIFKFTGLTSEQILLLRNFLMKLD